MAATSIVYESQWIARFLRGSPAEKLKRMTRVAILRCGKLPSFVDWEIPNLEELFEEDRLLIHGLEAQGFHASSMIWSQPNIDWNQFDVALIRSTWDYLDEQELFLQILARIEASSCRLFNSFEAVRWNIDKHYLFDLEKWGVPIIPTYLTSNSNFDILQNIFLDHKVQSVILKPTIGLGGSHSYRVPVAELNETLIRLKDTQPQHEYLIQPFVENIISEGEWSFIYFNNQLSHVLLKKPAPNDYRVQGIYGGTIVRAEPLISDVIQADAVITKLPFDLLYARLDFVRVQGQLSVIEIELIEPIFSFNLVPESIARLANAIKRRGSFPSS
jgi:glutathione synthase/RimK-type ligase-like ATP-grasp enzyme